MAKPRRRIKPTGARAANIAAYYQALMVQLRPFFLRARAAVASVGDSLGGGRFQDAIDPTAAAAAEASLKAALEAMFEMSRALNAAAPNIAARMAARANAAQRRDMIAAFRKGAGVDISKLSETAVLQGRSIDGVRVAATIDEAVANNVNLIKTIPQEYMSRVRALMGQMAAGQMEGKSLRASLMEIEGVTARRAQLIARDQTQKLVNSLAQARQQDLGIDSYIWRASKDSRTRPSHEANDGKVFRWDSPPPETGHPGEDINCRCTAEPVISELLL